MQGIGADPTSTEQAQPLSRKSFQLPAPLGPQNSKPLGQYTELNTTGWNLSLGSELSVF